MYGANEAAVLDDRNLPRYIRITDVKADGTLHDDTFRSLEEDVAAPFLLNDGDILLARSGATVGKSFQYLASWGRAAYAGYLIRFRPDKDVIYPRFANYYFQTGCYWASINSTLVQATIENFSAEKYKDLKLPLPPPAEQQQIAAFLDWKTGQIDSLIARKKELLEKLKEKRLALITQAVTRGLNPAAPLRDSGTPWLGSVPAHWEVKRLRFATSRIEQGWSPQCESQPADEGFWGVMKVGCVNGDNFDPTENKALPAELEAATEYELRPGDILISRANTRELLGSAAIVPEGTRSKLLLCDKLYRVSPEPGLRNDFLTLFLRTPVARFQYEREATGASSSMQNIAQATIKNLPTVIPPLGEQQAICDHVRLNVTKLDTLLGAVEAAVDRLTEYRTALITAATTGKIDVRKISIPVVG
jgi:type I restriction enzyme S subunit